MAALLIIALWARAIERSQFEEQQAMWREISKIVSLVRFHESTSGAKEANYADRDYFKTHATDPADQLLIGQPVVVALDPAFFAMSFDKTRLLARCLDAMPCKGPACRKRSCLSPMLERKPAPPSPAGGAAVCSSG